MRRVDEHESRDRVRVPCREDAHDEAAERMTDEKEWRLDTRAIEQDAQLISHTSGRARHRSGLAPSEARAIVAADAGQPCHLRLDE